MAKKRVRKPSAKAAASSPSADSSSGDEDTRAGKRPKARRIVWNAERTERLLDWLEENPGERQKLFSDSSKDAKDEGRRKRVAKSTKSEFHKMIAGAVFSVDLDAGVRADYRDNPTNYTKSVDNYIIRYAFSKYPSDTALKFFCRLRKEYRAFNEKLGQTGAGLRYEDIEGGSSLQNLVGESCPDSLHYPN